jgi:hypothetical protein
VESGGLADNLLLPVAKLRIRNNGFRRPNFEPVAGSAVDLSRTQAAILAIEQSSPWQILIRFVSRLRSSIPNYGGTS